MGWAPPLVSDSKLSAHLHARCRTPLICLDSLRGSEPAVGAASATLLRRLRHHVPCEQGACGDGAMRMRGHQRGSELAGEAWQGCGPR
eukprot:1647549-Rhodomonas_salina.1